MFLGCNFVGRVRSQLRSYTKFSLEANAGASSFCPLCTVLGHIFLCSSQPSKLDVKSHRYLSTTCPEIPEPHHNHLVTFVNKYTSLALASLMESDFGEGGVLGNQFVSFLFCKQMYQVVSEVSGQEASQGFLDIFGALLFKIFRIGEMSEEQKETEYLKRPKGWPQVRRRGCVGTWE